MFLGRGFQNVLFLTLKKKYSLYGLSTNIHMYNGNSSFMKQITTT